MNYSRILVVLGQAKSEKTVKEVEYKKVEGREGTHQVSWRWRAPRQREVRVHMEQPEFSTRSGGWCARAAVSGEWDWRAVRI